MAIPLAFFGFVMLLASVHPVSAFWRLPCKTPIVTQRADPLVSPGTVSGHVHTIMGSNGFGFSMDYASTQASTCSSCTVTKDMSNYWVPTLYYQAQNGSLISVTQNGGATVYYLQRSDPKDPEYSEGLLAFPEGFRMLAGSPDLRSYNDTLEQNAITFACLGTTYAETNGLPNYDCPGGLRAQVFFPSCWNGTVNATDNKSHMSYPSTVDSGYCPESHPKRFISIFYEVIWNTPDFSDMWYGESQPFVFSNGDSTGYGYHGDFVNGWDVPTLQSAVDQCNAASGVVEDCPVFDFITDDAAEACKIPASINEQVLGVMDALPGCNPIQSGPENAVSHSGCGAPTVIGELQMPYVDLSASKDFEYVGCGADLAGQPRTLGGASIINETSMTVEYCVEFCVSNGYSVAGVEYSSQCFCDNSIPADRAPVPGLMGDCSMPCSGNSTEICGGAALISLYQKCRGTCQNVQYYLNTGVSSSSSVSAVSSILSTIVSLTPPTTSSTTQHMSTSDQYAAGMRPSQSTPVTVNVALVSHGTLGSTHVRSSSSLFTSLRGTAAHPNAPKNRHTISTAIEAVKRRSPLTSTTTLDQMTSTRTITLTTASCAQGDSSCSGIPVTTKVVSQYTTPSTVAPSASPTSRNHLSKAQIAGWAVLFEFLGVVLIILLVICLFKLTECSRTRNQTPTCVESDQNTVVQLDSAAPRTRLES